MSAVLLEIADSAGSAVPQARILTGVARPEDFPHAGALSPVDAWKWVRLHGVALVDVRTAEERKFVGYVPGSVHVPWATGTALNRNPRFVRELETKIAKDQPVLLLCRSGSRSAQALDAAVRAGFTRVAQVAEGFEGELDTTGQRGHKGGWRFHGLPWIQD